jgi:hypothetical protein
MSWFLRNYMEDPMFFGRVLDPGSMSMLMAGGAGMKVGGDIFSGISAKNQADAEAKADVINSSRALAVGQQKSFNVNEKAAQVMGTEQARAAASGAGDGATIADIQSEMEGKRATAAGDAIAQGMTDRDKYLYAAKLAKYKGNAALIGSILQGGGDALTGGYKVAKMRAAPSGGGYDPTWSDTTVGYG